MAKPMIGSGPFVQDLPDTFEFPYRREDADTKDTQEQPYDDHLSHLHMRKTARPSPTGLVSRPVGTYRNATTVNGNRLEHVRSSQGDGPRSPGGRGHPYRDGSSLGLECL
jgi:hypothetical protein